MLTRLFATLMLVLLTSCAAGLKEEYSCTHVGGVPGCISMDQVRQDLTGSTRSQPHDLTFTAPTDFLTLPRRDRQGAPSRTEEVVKKVTVFPFIDPQGHYVDTTDVYVILNNRRWTGRPPRAIWKD